MKFLPQKIVKIFQFLLKDYNLYTCLLFLAIFCGTTTTINQRNSMKPLP